MTRSLLAPAVVAFTVALAGCGGSSLSSGQMQIAATRICTAAVNKTEQIRTPASPAATGRFLERGVAVLTPELTRLRALHAPDDAADVYAATLHTLERKIGEMKNTARAIARGDDPVRALQALQSRLGPLESQENGGWKALQLPACLSR